MKAIVHTRYGAPAQVLEYREVEKPAPKDDEVLVRIRASSLNSMDHRFLSGLVPRMAGLGLRHPNNRIPGVDIAGQVEALGKDAAQFQPGDAVFGELSGRGGFAEYVAVPEKLLALKPAGVSFEQAAAVPLAGVTALQGLRDYGKIQPGQKVLIHGASGGVGSFAVQIARALGADVTAVCSARNLDLARSLGAGHVIDYTREDFTLNGQRYDLILAANGDRSIWDYRRALGPQGIYVMAGGSWKQIIQAALLGPRLSKPGGKQLGTMLAKADPADLVILAAMIAAGSLAPFIERCYPLAEVPEAMRYFGEGHVQGKIVITMAD